MTDDFHEQTHLLQRAAGGDERALQELFARHRDRLKRMVHLRLSRRLQGRVDDSDVLQETFLDVARRLQEYAADPKLPFYLWLRHMAGLKLAEIHRRHLGTQLRDADREVTLHRGGLPEADSVSLAAHLLGQLTPPSQAAIKAETRLMATSACLGISEHRERMLQTASIRFVGGWARHGFHRLQNSLSAGIHVLLQSNGPGKDHRVENQHRHSQQNRDREAKPGERDEADPSDTFYSGEDENRAFPSAFRFVREIQSAAPDFVEVNRVRHGLSSA